MVKIFALIKKPDENFHRPIYLDSKKMENIMKRFEAALPKKTDVFNYESRNAEILAARRDGWKNLSISKNEPNYAVYSQILQTMKMENIKEIPCDTFEGALLQLIANSARNEQRKGTADMEKIVKGFEAVGCTEKTYNENKYFNTRLKDKHIWLERFDQVEDYYNHLVKVNSITV